MQLLLKQNISCLQLWLSSVNMIMFCAVSIGFLITLAIGWVGTTPAPVLTKTPDYPVYLTGEAVTLDCIVDDPHYHKQFTFFKHNAELSPQWSPTYHIYSVPNMSGDKYTCQYKTWSFTSPMSNSITLFVLDPPLAPIISLNPPLNTGSGDRYIWGESVSVKCTSPQLNMKGAQYYIDGKVTHTVNVTGREATYKMLVSGRKLSVTCKYWRTEYERQIESLMSDPVTLKITEPPPSASISLRPSRSVYTRDESIDLICTPPKSYPVRGILYYKDGKEIYSVNLPHIQSSYSVPRNAAGNYVCGYWIETEGRKILSYGSDHVTIRRTDFTSTLSSTLITKEMEAPTTKGLSTPLASVLITRGKESHTSKGLTILPLSSTLITKMMEAPTSKGLTTLPLSSTMITRMMEAPTSKGLTAGLTTPFSAVLITRVMEAPTSKVKTPVMEAHTSKVPDYAISTSLNSNQPLGPDIFTPSAGFTPADIEPKQLWIYGITGGAIMILTCVVVVILLKAQVCSRGKKHRNKSNHVWTNNNSTDMETEISGNNKALLVMPALDQDTNDKLHIYCEIDVTPLASNKPKSSPKPKPAIPPTIPPPFDALLHSQLQKMNPIYQCSTLEEIATPQQKSSNINIAKQRAPLSDALLDSTVMKTNPLYSCSPLK
ncbi:uncharacterized protein LOC121399457 [Xenopus laevis]|uniref:Uncharacterized protein LOC121399457 n=2 Tax=Xenopus laevis TaxID=8355 RepID=A0A1L8HPN3_XENLA|nr:uncharacterized protein LOC121399457 [Xenopus laevis]OCT98059.1 hypothetical protein XELAEV_18010287mg [Xenopus laevis]